MQKFVFTAEMDALLCELYPHTSNKKIAELTGWDVEALWRRSVKLGLKKTRACKAKTANATEWTENMISYLRHNFFTQTNRQLADSLNVGLTVLRNKTHELGLVRNIVDPWNAEQSAYLVANYRSMGDVEISEQLQQLWPGKRLWTKKRVNKKRQLLGLHRTKEQIEAIIAKHVAPGGRSFTILQNSSSLNLCDSYVAGLIAWRDKDLQKELLKYPDILEVKRQEIKLSRAIKGVKNA